MATFLDEFRIMLLTPGVPGFTIFDSFVPHGHPVSSRWFRQPPRYHNWSPFLYVDDDRCLGELNRDRPVTDPTQAVIVSDLVADGRARCLLIVRLQTLIKHACSVGVGDFTWDVWGRGAVVKEGAMRGMGHPTCG